MSKRKRPLDPEDTENDSSDNMSKNYCSFGRIYSRQSSPFNTVDSVVNFGIRHEAPDDDSDIEPKTLTTQLVKYHVPCSIVCSVNDREKRLLYSWKVICGVIPGFRVDMLALATQRKV